MAQKGEYFFFWGGGNISAEPAEENHQVLILFARQKREALLSQKPQTPGVIFWEREKEKKTQYKNNKVCFCSAEDKKKKITKPVRADGPRVERGRGGIL